LDIDNKIKKALNSNKFISAKILGISDERFSERMIELEKSGVVRKRDANNSNYLDTDNFVICAEDSSNVSITVNGTTNFTNNVNATAQMGLLNNTLIHN
jgi:DNA-binding Lrp family transcriptional regulator